MNPKGLLAALCLIAGIPLAAYGLAGGGALFTFPGLALVLAFWYFAWTWITKAGKPQVAIKPAANAAWGMRDQPVGAATPASAASNASGPNSPLSPSPSPAAEGGEKDGGAARRDKE